MRSHSYARREDARPGNAPGDRAALVPGRRTTGPTRHAPPHAAPDLFASPLTTVPQTTLGIPRGTSLRLDRSPHRSPDHSVIHHPIHLPNQLSPSAHATRSPTLHHTKHSPPQPVIFSPLQLPPLPHLHAPSPPPPPRCSGGAAGSDSAAPWRCRLRAHLRAAMIAMLVHSTAYSSVTTTRASLLMQEVS